MHRKSKTKIFLKCNHTSYPVMAIRCMESLTAFRMPKMEVRASWRSSQPSQPLLYFNNSCKRKRGKHGQSSLLCTWTSRPSCHVNAAHLQQQLVLGDSLDGFKEVGVQSKFMIQLLLTLLLGGVTGGRSK